MQCGTKKEYFDFIIHRKKEKDVFVIYKISELKSKSIIMPGEMIIAFNN
jgi:hypothetical protein